MTSMGHRPGSWWLARSYNPSAIYNCDSKRFTGLKNTEQHLNLLAGTGAGWLMSFERHLCQTKVIVFVIVLLSFWTLNLPRILEVSCSKS